MFELSEEQQIAVNLSRHSRFAVLTGGPGTGKTTTLRAVIEAATSDGVSVKLLAPTGKAAARAAAQTGCAASTIHRALGWHPEAGAPAFGTGSPWPEELIIVDEVSMVDSALAAKLFAAIGRRSRVLLVGDVNQLPPVSPGSLLSSILAIPDVQHVHLSRIYRQGEGSPIIDAAYAVLNGELPKTGRNDAGTFYHLDREGSAAREALLSMVTRRIPEAYGFGSDEEIQALSMRRTGPLSVEELNSALKPHFNPSAPYVKGLHRGDRVLNVQNDYLLGVFNGETGTIVARGSGDDSRWATVKFHDRTVTYPEGVDRMLMHAWGLTVHKSQGSEFRATVIVLDKAHGRLLYRQALYTAITRAKEVCVVIASTDVLKRCVSTVSPPRRSSIPDRVATIRAARNEGEAASPEV